LIYPQTWALPFAARLGPRMVIHAVTRAKGVDDVVQPTGFSASPF